MSTPTPAPQTGINQATITSASYSASRFRMPSWGWLLLGLILGLAIAATLVLWKPEWVGLQYSPATPAVQPAEATPVTTPPVPAEGVEPTPTPATP